MCAHSPGTAFGRMTPALIGYRLPIATEAPQRDSVISTPLRRAYICRSPFTGEQNSQAESRTHSGTIRAVATCRRQTTCREWRSRRFERFGQEMLVGTEREPKPRLPGIRKSQPLSYVLHPFCGIGGPLLGKLHLPICQTAHRRTIADSNLPTELMQSYVSSLRLLPSSA